MDTGVTILTSYSSRLPLRGSMYLRFDYKIGFVHYALFFIYLHQLLVGFKPMQSIMLSKTMTTIPNTTMSPQIIQMNELHNCQILSASFLFQLCAVSFLKNFSLSQLVTSSLKYLGNVV